MVYRFVIISDEVKDFRRDIKIAADATFLELQRAIVQSVGFDPKAFCSFTICDADWSPLSEITLTDDFVEEDEECNLMADLTLGEKLLEEKQKLLFNFDMIAQRAFFIELRNIIDDEELAEYQLIKSEGNPPIQEKALDEVFGDFNEDDLFGDNEELVDIDELDPESYQFADDLADFDTREY